MNNSILSHLLFLAATAPSSSTAFLIGRDNIFGLKNNLNAIASERQRLSSLSMANEKIGIFFGTSTGSTESVAYLIADEFGSDVAADPIAVDDIQGNVAKTFGEYDALIVGTPTWNTGADNERSGTAWDEIYYKEMQDLQIKNKKVAVFGLGDSVSYSENYADASGELHDVFESLGCKLMGYTSQDGYEHEESKSIRGDRFCGLMIDAVNQEDMTEGRVTAWVKQLIAEGILESSSDGGATTTSVSPPPAPVAAVPSAPVMEESTASVLEENSRLLDESISIHGSDEEGFVPHYNAKTGRTMWTSPDGRSCYYTFESTKISNLSP